MLEQEIHATLYRARERVVHLSPRFQQQLASLLDPVREYLDAVEEGTVMRRCAEAAYVCRACERAGLSERFDTLPELVKHRAKHGPEEAPTDGPQGGFLPAWARKILRGRRS